MVISYCKIIPKRTFHIPVKMAVGNVNPNTKKKLEYQQGCIHLPKIGKKVDCVFYIIVTNKNILQNKLLLTFT